MGGFASKGNLFCCGCWTQMGINVCSQGLCFVPEEKPPAQWERNLNNEVRRKEDLGSAR